MNYIISENDLGMIEKAFQILGRNKYREQIFNEIRENKELKKELIVKVINDSENLQQLASIVYGSGFILNQRLHIAICENEYRNITTYSFTDSDIYTYSNLTQVTPVKLRLGKSTIYYEEM